MSATGVQEGEADESGPGTNTSSSDLREEADATRTRRRGDSDRTGTDGAPEEATAPDDEGDEEARDAADEDDDEEAALPTPLVGANLNGRPRLLDGSLHLLDASNTTWVRAFFDVREKNRNGIPPRYDPDVVALRRAARDRDCRLIVSLKWDFRGVWGHKEPTNVPRQGSRRARELRRCATRYLRNIGAPVDVVVLGNEPMWETLPADVRVDDPPIVRFTRDLKDHLVRHGDHGDASYLVGSFNRTYDDETREEQFPQFHRAMFRMAREDDDVDGVDLHLHYDAFNEAEDAVAIAREAVPDGTITATEFSPVWRYRRHADDPLAAFDAGAQLTATTDIPRDLTVAEYFQRAKSDPLSPRELAGFYRSMPWYNVDHVDDVYALLAEYDVSVGTMGFLQAPRMRQEDWTGDWAPFHVNFLYQPALLDPDRRVEDTAIPEYINDYRDHAA